MIKRLELHNFKAFERFRIDFRGDGYLVGPNNAGKSTILAALRASAYMVRMAARRKPTDITTVRGATRWGFRFGGSQVRLVDENLRHDFRPIDTRLVVHFSSKAVLEAVWSSDDDDEDESSPAGFFYLHHDGAGVREPSQVRRLIPTIGVVPVLSPIEHDERLLSDEYVRDSMDSRLASRHLRNQLRLLHNETSDSDPSVSRLTEFRAFAAPWLPGLSLGDLRTQFGAETSIDLFYEESGSRIPKEIFWAGDGVQIWLQLLLHLYRLRDRQVIILDEPDVFLHADLQRRMVDLLESVPAQTITATHSSEVLAEAQNDAILWISKDRLSAVRAPTPHVLYELSNTLGTQFNLRLARALRARTVLFVEGQDAKLLRALARTLEIERIGEERDLAIVPIIGFDRWQHVEPFQWLVSDLLENSVTAYVVLDRDCRPQRAVDEVQQKLAALNIRSHIWHRNELENYLLHPAAIARLTKADRDWIVQQLDDCATSMEDDVWGQLHAEYERLLKREGKSGASIAKLAKQAADKAWRDGDQRLQLCGGKDLLRSLNVALQSAGFKAVTDRKLAETLRADEIPDEVRQTLQSIAST